MLPKGRHAVPVCCHLVLHVFEVTFLLLWCSLHQQHVTVLPSNNNLEIILTILE